MGQSGRSVSWTQAFLFVIAAVAVGGVAVASAVGLGVFSGGDTSRDAPERLYQPRRIIDTSGFAVVGPNIPTFSPGTTLKEIADSFQRLGHRSALRIDRRLARNDLSPAARVNALLEKAACFCYEGEPTTAYAVLQEARSLAESDDAVAEEYLYTIVYFQGVAALRRGEDENCIACRGESSCIVPIVPAAVHTNPAGSRLAVKHFTEYLEQFPDDHDVRWLLNLAHMTLGEHPDRVDPRFLVELARFGKPEFDIGKFRDVGHIVGVNRLNGGGSGIMEDFDNDGLLDIVVSTFDPTQAMAFYRNRGDGTFADLSEKSGLSAQFGGFYCVQTDYDNDGHMDIFVCRGAWVESAMPCSLLRGNGDGTFTDVTHAARLSDLLNASSAAWADFDNDGRLDLYVSCERQPNRLYRNQGDGTFADVAARAGVQGSGKMCKGAAWIDYDNDGRPDLFVTYLNGTAELHRNKGDGTFEEVTGRMGIGGPWQGFSCWAWDYDNDGWLDLFATSFDRTLTDVVRGFHGQPHTRKSNKLFRNVQGKRFEDVTRAAGLDLVFSTMGSNFGDLDNDGYLDFYLGTGEPDLAGLVPNRMFKGVAGKRFAEITVSAGAGHLQKGHGVAIGDWDRDGDNDVFIQMGGAIEGDRYHNILFQNPGQGNHWLRVKLVGKKTNRAAIGARIKLVTDGADPLTVHRHISTGSSFGANPLEQTIGLGKAAAVRTLEVNWPTSGTTQVFRDIAVNQAIEITEFAKDYRKLPSRPISLPPGA